MIGFCAQLLSVDEQSERRVWRLETGSTFVSLSDYVKSDGWCSLSTMVQADLSDVALAKAEEINPPKPDFLPEPDAPPVPDPERPHPTQPIPEVPTVPKPPIPPPSLARSASRLAERGTKALRLASILQDRHLVRISYQEMRKANWRSSPRFKQER
ncbi:MAG: hypothetical protein JO308_14140 [Verrucomicrobia bacterium]|nr:hypothetical protein [Verrucomicrobiota bacterium]